MVLCRAHLPHVHGGKPRPSGINGFFPTRTSTKGLHVRPESRDTRSVIRTSSCPFTMAKSIALRRNRQKGQADYPTWVTAPMVGHE